MSTHTNNNNIGMFIFGNYSCVGLESQGILR